MPLMYPRAGQQWLAGIVRTALAASEMKLYQSSLVPTELTTLAELTAAEADFTGYAPIAMANWGAVFQSPLGAAIQSPLNQFQVTAPVVTTNDIGGAWVETAGGVLVVIISFPEPVAMATALSAIPLTAILRYGSGL